jgi:glucose-1-phosphate thymidylyltransferase
MNVMPSFPRPVGVVCAGGSGTRLWPLTVGVNKHLLPVFNKPMIHYSMSVLMCMGVRDIVVVTNQESREALERAIGDGRNWGLRVSIRVQSSPDGIVGCVLSATDLIGERPTVVILGDNFFYGSRLTQFLEHSWSPGVANIFTRQVTDPRSFAVVVRDISGVVRAIIEKPDTPPSSEVATGLYCFPPDLLDMAAQITPSSRGELEITSLNESYLADGRLLAHELPRGTVWFDCGTPSDLLRASQLVHDLEENGEVRISSLDEIAWRRQWISDEQLRNSFQDIPDSQYAAYLAGLLKPGSVA